MTIAPPSPAAGPTHAADPALARGSASIWVLAQVAGGRRTARVVHAGPHAVYLDLEGRCLAVLAAGAVPVPCGVRTSLPALPPIGRGDEVTVVDGSIDLPGREVLVTTLVDTTVPVLSPEEAAWGAATLAERATSRLGPVRDHLPGGALAALGAADPAAVPLLLGLGPGLTPVGDDVLAGWLATAVAARRSGLAAVRREVASSAFTRTTLLSATLLGCAARGEGVPEFRTLLRGVADRRADVVEQSLHLLLRIGDTSGAGLLLGALLALGDTLPEGRR